MRLIAICLTALLMLIQYPLWLGKGGWLRVWDMGQQVDVAHVKIEDLKARNAKLDSEVHDLKEGTGAIEERARSELGMIKQDEIFIQILDPNNTEVVATLLEAQQLSDKVGAAVAVKPPLVKPGEKLVEKPEQKPSASAGQGVKSVKSGTKPVTKTQSQSQSFEKATALIRD